MPMIEDAHEQFNQALAQLPSDQLSTAQNAIARAIEIAAPLFEGADASEATESLSQLRKALTGTEQAQQITAQLHERITTIQQRLGRASTGQGVEMSPGNVTSPDAPKWYHQPIDEEDRLRVRFDARFRAQAREALLDAYGQTSPNPSVFEFAEGDFHRVYLTEDGKYVIKVPRPKVDGEIPADAAQDIREKVAALKIGKGQPGLEQIVACSDDLYSPAIVCEFVEGKDSRWVTSEEINAMSDQQLEDLATTLAFMQSNGLNLDPIRNEHTVYNPDKGVTIIDYTLQEVETAMDEGEEYADPPQTIEDKITTVMNKTTLLRLCDRADGLPPVAVRFREICRQKFGQSAADVLTRQWQEDGFIS